MSRFSDAELYLRGRNTLLASWEAYACGAVGAAVKRSPGVAAAVFPGGPERAVYNNALLQPDLGPGERAEALDAMETAYAAVGLNRFAAWVHESDRAMRGELERRGYTLDITTRAMGMALDDIRLPRPDIQLGTAAWLEYLSMEGLPPDFLADADHAAFHVLVTRSHGEIVAAALAYDFADDCGIYNVVTVEKARRRGLGTALTAAQVHDALARGCQTASLQSTQMAELAGRSGRSSFIASIDLDRVARDVDLKLLESSQQVGFEVAYPGPVLGRVVDIVSDQPPVVELGGQRDLVTTLAHA